MYVYQAKVFPQVMPKDSHINTVGLQLLVGISGEGLNISGENYYFLLMLLYILVKSLI